MPVLHSRHRVLSDRAKVFRGRHRDDRNEELTGGGKIMPDANTRVLYVGFILLGDSSATGHTLSNLFSRCTHTKVLQYCLDYTADFHNTDCETIYLSRKKSRLYIGLKKIYRRCMGQQGSNSASISAVHAGKKSIVSELGKAMLDVLPKGSLKKRFKK